MSKLLNASASMSHRLGVAVRALARVCQGIGAPKGSSVSAAPSRRLILPALATILGTLAVTAAAAVAAAPETPELSAEASTAVVASPSTEALFEAVLNPKAASFPVEAGTYQFVYRPSSKAENKCKGSGEKLVPAGAAMYFGLESELISETVTGLTVSTEYSVCLVVEDDAGTTVSSAVSFKTALPPEKPETLSPAKSITATQATLEGTLNPKTAGEAGTYEFLYRVSATECEGESATPAQSALGHLGEAVKATIAPTAPLQPNATYAFCLLSRNAAGEAAIGNAVAFKTEPAPPEITSENASNIKASEVTFEGAVNPNNQLTECHFQYGEALVSEHEVSCTPESLKGFGEQNVSPMKSEVQEGGIVMVPAPVGGLNQKTVYRYRIVTTNGKGEEGASPEKEFTTAFPPEAPEKAAATAVTTTTATLHGVLNPASNHESEPGTYEFVYRQSATECQRTNPQTGQQENENATPPESATGGEKQAVQAPVTALLPGGAVYTFCLVSRNNAGETAISPPETLTTQAIAPKLEEQSTTGISSTGATLNTKINPNGAATTYHVEYDTTAYHEGEAAHGTSTVAVVIPAGNAPVPISQQIEGLSPNTEYHWRVVATNTAGTSTSPDHVFDYATSGESLPNDRAYEMVTPVQKNGGLIGDVYGGAPPSLSESGARLIALTIQCFAPAESCVGLRGGTGEPYEFTRTSEGWKSSALAPPATQFSENSPWLFDANHGTALFSMPTGPEGEDEWYARSPEEAFSRIGPALPPGTAVTGINPFKLRAKDATGDLSHLVWQSQRPGIWPFDSTKSGESLYEYVGFNNPHPFLVGVTGQSGSSSLISSCSATFNTLSGYRPLKNALSTDGRTVYFTAHAEANGEPCLSGSGANGALPVPVNELYVRIDGEEAGAHTVAISQPNAPQTVAESSRGHESPPDNDCTEPACIKNTEAFLPPAINPSWRAPEFAGASADGSMAFFLDTQQLTNTAIQGVGSAENDGCGRFKSDCNLYLYDFSQSAGDNLIDVSTPEASGEDPGVLGVVALSEDGSHVYFVANGVLTGVANDEGAKATSGDCKAREGQEGQEGNCNLYVYERDAQYPDGHTAFIASLPGLDYLKDWSEEEASSANVTPDGRFLVFASRGDLTPDDTNGTRSAQIFRYDAETEELLRISLGENGFADNGNGGAGEATIVPPDQSEVGTRRGDPTMSNNGDYVVFQSAIGLTPHALNDVVIGHQINVKDKINQTEYAQNVYEWEAAGTDLDGQVGCTQTDGCVHLISDGHDASGANTACDDPGRIETNAEWFGAGVCLLGTDATGANVFFTTADQLVPKDTDTQVDIYDARICEPEQGNPCITESVPPVPPCAGEACHGIPPGRAALASGGSATFNGAENEAATTLPPKVNHKALTRAQDLAKALGSCRKDQKKAKRKRCEASARKKYGAAKNAKRTSYHRRTSR